MALEANVRWVQKLQFVATAGSGHGLVLDTTPDHGGTDTGTTPMELVLVALAGCTGMDVVALLRKMRVNFTGLELNIRAERAAEHPMVYTKIDLEYLVAGPNLDEEKIRRAIELSQEKYCSVSAMLRKACPVNYTWRVVES
ncbi:MAG: OsmC family protein [candidate division WOR-3 bacterium]